MSYRSGYPSYVSNYSSRGSGTKRKKWTLPLIIGVIIILITAILLFVFLEKNSSEQYFHWNENITNALQIANCFGSGHQPVKDYGKDETCTENGLTDGEHCSICQTVITEQEIIPAAHTIVISPMIEPTCTIPGLSEGHYCPECQTVLLEQHEIPVSHKLTTIPAQPATCTNDGLNEGQICIFCREVFVKQEKLEAIGHYYEFGLCLRCGGETPVTPYEAFQFELLPDGTFAITDYHEDKNPNKYDVILPPTYQGRPITVIGEEAFSPSTYKENISFVYIELSENISIIEDRAFNGCESLEKIMIPESITRIGAEIFYRTKVSSLNYSGISENWEKISPFYLTKGSGFFGTEHKRFTVVCSDGEVTDY